MLFRQLNYEPLESARTKKDCCCFPTISINHSCLRAFWQNCSQLCIINCHRILPWENTLAFN